MEQLNYKRWENLVQKTLDDLPYIKYFKSASNHFFGSFLQTIYENLDLSPEELFHFHFIKHEKDLDIRVDNPKDDSENYTFTQRTERDIKNFFIDVFESGGIVEYAGTPYCSKYTRISRIFREFKDIDLLSNRRIPEGNYWAYIKYKNTYIKYDISYHVRESDIDLDFVANGLIYPTPDNEKSRVRNLCAMIDIQHRRIVPSQEFLTPKLLNRATKLLNKGYSFADNTHIQYMIARKENEETYYPQTLMFEPNHLPSYVVGKGDMTIRTTNHGYYNPNEKDLPDVYDQFMKKYPSFRLWQENSNNYMTRDIFGITTETMSFYRSAIVTGNNLEWVKYGTSDKEDQYIVVVELDVKKDSFFMLTDHKTCNTYKFDSEVVVKDIYAYYDKSVMDKVLSDLKTTPFELKDNKWVTMSGKDNFLYALTVWNTCFRLKAMIE